MTSRIQKVPECPNCHKALEGENYCPNCGQKNDVRRLTLWDFISESLSNFLAFDGRLFHTIHYLFRYPGRVPKEFSKGKRMRYMNPIRIYFLSSLLMLFVMEIKQGSLDVVKIREDQEHRSQDIDNTSVQPIENELSESDLALQLPDSAEQNLAQSDATEKQDTVPLAEKSALKRFGVMMDFYEAHPQQKVESALADLKLENNMWNSFLYTQAVKATNFDDAEFNRYLFDKLFWVFFLFVPVLAIILRLIYVRRDFYYSEHIFFAFYTQAVFFLIFAIGLIPPFSDKIIPVLILGFVIYQFFALYRFYGQRPGKTLVKFILLNGLSSLAFGIFFLISTVVVFILK